jgi:hypothetical protein
MCISTADECDIVNGYLLTLATSRSTFYALVPPV